MSENNTGNWNTGDRNTGNRNTGNRNTGDWNTGNRNTGYWNTGNCNTGYWNTGNCNTGDRNTGDRNTGNWNTGNHNTGYWNTGNCNTGGWNTGDRNTGNWNTGNHNTGYFNVDTPNTIRVFGKDVSRCDFDAWEKPSWLFFDLTAFVEESEMTDDEKESHAGYKTIGGYLKIYDFKDAFQKSYNKASREDQLKIKECPNFDADMFFEISGIRVDEEPEEMTMEELCKELGRNIKIKQS